MLKCVLEGETRIKDDMYGKLAQLKCPALIIWGNQDMVCAQHLVTLWKVLITFRCSILVVRSTCAT